VYFKATYTRYNQLHSYSCIVYDKILRSCLVLRQRQHCKHCTALTKTHTGKFSAPRPGCICTACGPYPTKRITFLLSLLVGGSVAEWLACWRRRAWVQIAAATLSGNSLRQTVHTHRASVHQATKLVAALLRIVGLTAGLAESDGSLPSGLWFTSPAGWLPRTGISSGTLRSVIEYGLPLLF